jgi:hypothetical protein
LRFLIEFLIGHGGRRDQMVGYGVVLLLLDWWVVFSEPDLLVAKDITGT